MIKGIIWDFNRTIYDPDLPRENSDIKGGLTPGITRILRQLHQADYRMCLISKAADGGRMGLISDFGLSEYFRHIELVSGNKTVEHFQHCLTATELKYFEMAVVGDRVWEEIRIGKLLHMRTIWYAAGKFSGQESRCPEEQPDFTIANLADVVDCLK